MLRAFEQLPRLEDAETVALLEKGADPNAMGGGYAALHAHGIVMHTLVVCSPHVVEKTHGHHEHRGLEKREGHRGLLYGAGTPILGAYASRRSHDGIPNQDAAAL